MNRILSPRQIAFFNKYVSMQNVQYEHEASCWSLVNRDPVVGSFDLHNTWSDYDKYLFRDIEETHSKNCLDFGCGPGRNLVKYFNRFNQIDGVDIAKTNLEKASLWINESGFDSSHVNLYLTGGYDLSNIPDASYDVIMSTICMQHICVYDIRFNFFSEFFRILRPKGYITIQMGFGPETYTKRSVPYYADFFDASGTNGQCDTRVEHPSQLKDDLECLGFRNFKYYLADTGPGDGHLQWIFFNAQKV
jgi:ubiquinone/menaquinone biosynthesis C-methylase UbiE